MSDDLGTTIDESDIPAEYAEQAKEYRAAMVEAAAEVNEELMEKFFEDGDLSTEDIMYGIRTRTIAGQMTPVLCGTSLPQQGRAAALGRDRGLFTLAGGYRSREGLEQGRRQGADARAFGR